METKKEKDIKFIDEKTYLAEQSSKACDAKEEYIKLSDEIERLTKELAKKVKYDPSYAAVVGKLAAAGFNEEDIGWILGVCKRTIRYWKAKYPLFKQAIEEGKKFVKKKLVASAIRAAVGYDYEEVETIREYDKESDKFISKREIRKKKHHPINASLLTFLLVNLDRQLGDNEWYHPWASVYKDIRGQVNINIDGKLESERIERLCGKLLESEDKAKKVEAKIINNEDR